jgi:hypothetical protein
LFGGGGVRGPGQSRQTWTAAARARILLIIYIALGLNPWDDHDRGPYSWSGRPSCLLLFLASVQQKELFFFCSKKSKRSFFLHIIMDNNMQQAAIQNTKMKLRSTSMPLLPTCIVDAQQQSFTSSIHLVESSVREYTDSGFGHALRCFCPNDGWFVRTCVECRGPLCLSQESYQQLQQLFVPVCRTTTTTRPPPLLFQHLHKDANCRPPLKNYFCLLGCVCVCVPVLCTTQLVEKFCLNDALSSLQES